MRSDIIHLASVAGLPPPPSDVFTRTPGWSRAEPTAALSGLDLELRRRDQGRRTGKPTTVDKPPRQPKPPKPPSMPKPPKRHRPPQKPKQSRFNPFAMAVELQNILTRFRQHTGAFADSTAMHDDSFIDGAHTPTRAVDVPHVHAVLAHCVAYLPHNSEPVPDAPLPCRTITTAECEYATLAADDDICLYAQETHGVGGEGSEDDTPQSPVMRIENTFAPNEPSASVPSTTIAVEAGTGPAQVAVHPRQLRKRPPPTNAPQKMTQVATAADSTPSKMPKRPRLERELANHNKPGLASAAVGARYGPRSRRDATSPAAAVAQRRPAQRLMSTVTAQRETSAVSHSRPRRTRGLKTQRKQDRRDDGGNDRPGAAARAAAHNHPDNIISVRRVQHPHQKADVVDAMPKPTEDAIAAAVEAAALGTTDKFTNRRVNITVLYAGGGGDSLAVMRRFVGFGFHVHVVAIIEQKGDLLALLRHNLQLLMRDTTLRGRLTISREVARWKPVTLGSSAAAVKPHIRSADVLVASSECSDWGPHGSREEDSGAKAKNLFSLLEAVKDSTRLRCVFLECAPEPIAGASAKFTNRLEPPIC